jgi:hypothetical protein
MLLGGTGLLIVALAFGVVIGLAYVIDVWTDPKRPTRLQGKKKPGRP